MCAFICEPIDHTEYLLVHTIQTNHICINMQQFWLALIHYELIQFSVQFMYSSQILDRKPNVRSVSHLYRSMVKFHLRTLRAKLVYAFLSFSHYLSTSLLMSKLNIVNYMQQQSESGQ